VPRAEFAAGGTFRFRGRYSYGENIEELTTLAVAGTQVTTGSVASISWSAASGASRHPPRSPTPVSNASEPLRPIKVLLADDEALVRSGVRWMLEAVDGPRGRRRGDGRRRGGRPRGAAAPGRRPHGHPHAGLDGIAATRRLLATMGETAPKVIVLTTFDFERNVYEALRAGASGFLLKDSEPERLVEGIRTVARGEALLAPAVARRLIEHFTATPRRHAALRGELAELTDREVELLALLARGLSNAELAERVGLTEATVKSHLSSTFSKLGLRSRIQAVVLAYETGLVEPGRGADA
jgi:DNA-binding NarL/FixJ family response regulator